MNLQTAYDLWQNATAPPQSTPLIKGLNVMRAKSKLKSLLSEPTTFPRKLKPTSMSRRLNMKPDAVALRTQRAVEKRLRAEILATLPPWLLGLKAEEVPITPTSLRRLGMWLSTFAEAAAFLGVSVEVLSGRLKKYPKLRRAWDDGHEVGKGTLRRRQLQVAFSDTPQAATMLVHLGKTILGQHERREVTGAGGGPVRYQHIRRTIVDPMLPEGEQEIDVTRFGVEEESEENGTRH